jgi:hypothetical protein
MPRLGFAGKANARLSTSSTHSMALRAVKRRGNVSLIGVRGATRKPEDVPAQASRPIFTIVTWLLSVRAISSFQAHALILPQYVGSKRRTNPLRAAQTLSAVVDTCEPIRRLRLAPGTQSLDCDSQSTFTHETLQEQRKVDICKWLSLIKIAVCPTHCRHGAV